MLSESSKRLVAKAERLTLNADEKRKMKNTKNKNSITDKISVVCLLCIVLYLAVMLPIRFCVVQYSWHWLVFGLFIILVFFTFIDINLILRSKQELSDIQKKNADKVTIKYILYFWLLDCLYMVIFNQWRVWIYILGIIVLIKVCYSLVRAFLGRRQKNAVLDICLIFDFILGIGLTIYLIYIIPSEFENLQAIVTTIVAGVYGGVLTLVGVAWTIRHSEKQKHEDELIKAKPLFTFNVMTEKNPLAGNRKVCLIGANEEVLPLTELMHANKNKIESYAELENSANSSFRINRIFYDNAWHEASANNIVLPSTKILIQLLRDDVVTHPVMEIEDIFSRKYYYDMMFIMYLRTYDNAFDGRKTTLYELKEITESELQKRKIEI